MRILRLHRTTAMGLLAAVAVLGVAVYFILIWHPTIPALTRLDPRSFPAALVERGAILAQLGDCDVCHTAEGGALYAGARGLPTPFGMLYATNITPDERSGIGNWSFGAFRRAMLDGVARDGSFLYPALPYAHFTHVTDEDLKALYAFLMTRTPVYSPSPSNALIFPLGFRPVLAGWNLLFLHHGLVRSDPTRSAQWNRGAYIVEGLGHCGACHTPLNIAGGEERGSAYGGGAAEGWNVPPLNASNPDAGTWTVDSLYNYLRTGIDAHHSAAAGPMGPVTHGLATVPEDDVRAVAVYVYSIMQTPKQNVPVATVDRATEAARAFPQGAALFAGACNGCHGPGAPMVLGGRPTLAQVSVLQEEDPGNTVQIILQGLQPPTGEYGPYMPAFADSLTNADVSQLAAYLRIRYSTRQAWSKLDKAVANIRGEDTGS
jgi:mono/diheme cytochrome c family protein